MWRNARALYRSARPLLKKEIILPRRCYYSDSNVYCFDDNQNSSENKNIDKFFTPDNVLNWPESSNAADTNGRIDRLLLFQLLERFSTDDKILRLCSEVGIDGKIFIYYWSCEE